MNLLLDRVAAVILLLASAAMIGAVLMLCYKAPAIGLPFVAFVAIVWALHRLCNDPYVGP